MKNPLIQGLLFVALCIAFGTISIPVIDAGSTKASSPIIINQNWARADAQNEFYQFQFPTMYNVAIKDIDTLYAQVNNVVGPGVASDSIYKLRMKAQRLWVDTLKTAAIYIPGKIAVDTNAIAQFTVTGKIDVDTIANAQLTITGMLDVDTMKTRFVAQKGINSTGVINTDSLQVGTGSLITKVYVGAADSLCFILAGGDTLFIASTKHLGTH
jgi:hypothetical protein